MGKQHFTCENGDSVFIDMPDEPVNREVSEASRAKHDKIKGFRRSYYRSHGVPPSADALHGMLRESKRQGRKFKDQEW